MKCVPLKSVFRQYVIVVTMNLSIITCGLAIAWPSPVLVKLSNRNSTILSEPLTEDEASWMNSIGSLTGIGGLFLMAYLLDGIGRKYSLILTALPHLIGCLMFTFATEFWMILVGRSLVGISEGTNFGIVSAYSSEIADKEIRGALGTVLQICSCIGMLIMYGIGPFLSYTILNIMYTSMVFVSFILNFFLPDSPYYLYSKGKINQSEKVLTKLRSTEAIVNEEIKEYSQVTNEKSRLTKVIKDRTFLKSLGIIFVISAGNQLTGYTPILTYLQTIFVSTRTTVSPEVSSLVIGCIQILGTTTTAFITDRCGRKPILCTTLAGITLAMVSIGIFFRLKESEYAMTGCLNFVPIISLVLISFCYSAGVGSIALLLFAELFDGPSRAIGMSAALLVGNIVAFISLKCFTLLITTLGASIVYWVFGFISSLLCIFIHFYVPETKGKTFLEIQNVLKGN